MQRSIVARVQTCVVPVAPLFTKKSVHATVATTQ
eukprot:COSAG06_NODE_65877_length_256_cov_0.299363_1_plen_33_part_01